jgi:hypothetical protein
MSHQDGPRARKPLRITFADGSVCKVELSASYHVVPDNAPYMIARFGTYDNAEAYIIAAIEAAAFTELEQLTLGEVRKQRAMAADAILRSARPRAADGFFTLDRVEIRKITAVGERLDAMTKIKVLFVAANPVGTIPLKLDEEAREIEMKIRASEHRDSLQLITKWAARADDLLQHLNEHKPHIVHFSDHGSETSEIFLLDERRQPKPVSKETWQMLFRTLKDNIRVVVLNACFSRSQAEAITQEIDCAAGMNRSFSDDAAIIFAASFYRAIGFGRSVQNAFDQAKTALMFQGGEGETPVLITRNNIDANSIILINPR